MQNINMENIIEIHIIGGGLAGSEAAWTLAQAGFYVIIHEMRPINFSEAHKSEYLAELVCSNSFRSDDYNSSAIGLLHEEMRIGGSLIMQCADKCKLPAGSALAVDRDAFSDLVTSTLQNHKNITIIREEIFDIPKHWKNVIIATGPLTSSSLASFIQLQIDNNSLYFYDAIAPIIFKDTINIDICWIQSRYDKVSTSGSEGDYINCPMNKEQYVKFVQALTNAEKLDFHAFEKDIYFDGCLPIEIMAERGENTLRFGPMKPRGLTNKHKPDEKPYAVVQLRQDNSLGTLYNMVGFQTKLKYNEQKEIFKTIPGLENAKFARLGGIHRNTYLNSPKLLNKDFSLKSNENIKFAGQIIGCEGYVESAAMGMLSAIFTITKYRLGNVLMPPINSAFGALHNHITTGYLHNSAKFQPMNINFGLFPPIDNSDNSKKPLKGTLKKQAMAERALCEFKLWFENIKKAGFTQP